LSTGNAFKRFLHNSRHRQPNNNYIPIKQTKKIKILAVAIIIIIKGEGEEQP
jgi:hypothetical protein